MTALTIIDRIIIAALKNNKFEKRTAASIAKQVVIPDHDVSLNLEIVTNVLNSPEHSHYIKKTTGRPSNYDHLRVIGENQLSSARQARELIVDEECEQHEIDEANQAVSSAEVYLAGVPENIPGKELYELNFEMFLIFRCAH